MSDLISVVLPVYNGEKYIAEAIDSILKQTYTNFELIIIDDGSTDNSLELIEKYKKQDSRIIIISRENRGLIATLNQGIEKAKGKYIARMDQDDISLPSRFEEQVNIMINDIKVVVCGSWINIFGVNKKDKIVKYYEKDKQIKANLLLSCCFAHPSVMIRKNLMIDNNIWYNNDFENAEDYHLWTQLAKVGEFYNIPKVLLNYRFLETSITRVADKNESQRKRIYTKIFTEALSLIGYIRTDEEIELSFIISHKDRIKVNKIDLKKLKIYFNRIVQANNQNNFADSFTLCKILGNRWLLNFIIHKNIQSIFSKYFWYGILSVFK